jgi:hypothetical protein
MDLPLGAEEQPRIQRLGVRRSLQLHVDEHSFVNSLLLYENRAPEFGENFGHLTRDRGSDAFILLPRLLRSA